MSERERFEAKFPDLNFARAFNDEFYISSKTNWTYQGWQAALADRPEQPVARDEYLDGIMNRANPFHGAAPVARPEPAQPPCAQCGGLHLFDTTVPSPTWNRVVRGAGLPDYLCLACIVKAFAAAAEGFTAELWGNGLDGLPIEVRINSVEARTAADLSAENTRLRAAPQELAQPVAHRQRLRYAFGDVWAYWDDETSQPMVGDQGPVYVGTAHPLYASQPKTRVSMGWVRLDTAGEIIELASDERSSWHEIFRDAHCTCVPADGEHGIGCEFVLYAAPLAKPAGELPAQDLNGESNAPPIVGTNRR